MNPAQPSPAGRLHQHMLGAALVRRLPGTQRAALNLERSEYGLFLLWLAYMGLLAFGAWLLWRAGAWHRLVYADPTGLTVCIVLLFLGTSLWAGRRAWVLGQQRLYLDAVVANAAVDQQTMPNNWIGEYQQLCKQAHIGPHTALQVLGERAHGPHEMAWWLNGIQLKLGLLGKVIGFSILALQLGQMESFDASQSAQLLKNLTGGLGIALLTTVTGLAGNILLGLQLMRLDRFADALLADTLVNTPAPQPPATPHPEPARGDWPTGS